MISSLIQWNCRGLRANIDELHVLIQDFNSDTICLQETLINDKNVITFQK